MIPRKGYIMHPTKERNIKIYGIRGGCVCLFVALIVKKMIS